MKQTYDRSIKAAQDYGIMKENPELVFFLCSWGCLPLFPPGFNPEADRSLYAGRWCMVQTYVRFLILHKPWLIKDVSSEAAQ